MITTIGTESIYAVAIAVMRFRAPGTAGRDGDCGLAGNAGVAACGMASVDLVADEYMTDICFI